MRPRPAGGFGTAVGFLTRFPATGGDAVAVARSAPWFPVVGGVLGLGLAGSYALAGLVLPPAVAAVLAVGLGVAATGALHEDGLADAADALGADTPARAREILADPAHGTFGVLALILSVLARATALAALGPAASFAWLPAAHALGRASMAGVARIADRGPGRGLGAGFAGGVTRGSAAAAVVVALLIAAPGLWWWTVPAAVVAAGAAAAVAGFCVRRFGALSGDVLGAVEQVVEILVLVLGAAVVARGWPGATW